MSDQLSSSATIFYKRGFPALWFGLLGLVLVGTILGSIEDGNWSAGAIVVPLIMIVFGYVIMRIFVFDLVDEVLEEEGTLIVSNRGRSDRIPFSNIINVESNEFVNPPRITLTLREPCSQGKTISFSPPRKLGFSFRSPVASDLIEKIEASRKQSHDLG